MAPKLQVRSSPASTCALSARAVVVVLPPAGAVSLRASVAQQGRIRVFAFVRTSVRRIGRLGRAVRSHVSVCGRVCLASVRCVRA
jgi:hypothetical protein